MLGSLMGAMVGTSGSSAGKTVGTWGILGEAPSTNPELPPSVISPALSRSAESGTVSPLLLSLTGWGTLAAGGSSAPPAANITDGIWVLGYIQYIYIYIYIVYIYIYIYK